MLFIFLLRCPITSSSYPPHSCSTSEWGFIYSLWWDTAYDLPENWFFFFPPSLMKWLLCRDSKLSQHRWNILQKMKQPFIIIEVIALQIIVSHLPLLVNWYSFQTPTLFQSLNSFSAAWPFMCCLKNYRHQSKWKATCSGYCYSLYDTHSKDTGSICVLLTAT